RGIAARLDAAEGGAEFCEGFIGGRADVAVGVHGLDAAREFYAARIESFGFERFGDNGDGLFGKGGACGEGAFKTAGGVAVDALAVDAVVFGKVFGGVAHGNATGGIVEGFPEEVPEFDPAHGEAVAVRIGGDGVAAHGFGAGGERQRGAA